MNRAVTNRPQATDASAWAYQPPLHPENYPEQCYYRVDTRRLSFRVGDDKHVTLYRHAPDSVVGLTIDHEHGSAKLTLDAAALLKLRNAICDALHDIAAVEADRERQESFDRISEEMREAEENGGPYAYYGHPDIHYVPADQVKAKVAELEAAGARRYMVLPLLGELA